MWIENLQMYKLGFRKGRGTRGQVAHIRWILEKERELQKNIYFCFIDDAKAFVCMDHNKLWKILKEMGIPDHLTCLLRNLHAGQEATVTRKKKKKQQLQPYKELQTSSKLGKEYDKAVYCDPV